MWKWIVGAALVLVLVLIGTCWYGYRRLTAGGDAASVTIGATPSRVFASLADPDSMAIWMAAGSTVTSSHHGVFAVGDTIHVERATPSQLRREAYTWTVAEVIPNQLLVFEMRNDTGLAVAQRRDSLAARGDSTDVISTIASPAMDSMRTQQGDTIRRVPNALLNMSSKVLIAAFRILSEQELHRLKARIEGTPMPAR